MLPHATPSPEVPLYALRVAGMTRSPLRISIFVLALVAVVAGFLWLANETHRQPQLAGTVASSTALS